MIKLKQLDFRQRSAGFEATRLTAHDIDHEYQIMYLLRNLRAGEEYGSPTRYRSGQIPAIIRRLVPQNRVALQVPETTLFAHRRMQVGVQIHRQMTRQLAKQNTEHWLGELFYGTADCVTIGVIRPRPQTTVTINLAVTQSITGDNQ